MTLHLTPRIENARQKLLESVWPEGRNPIGAPWDGGHYCLQGYERPVSVSTGEALLLASAAFDHRVDKCLEIGTGFGYSTSWIALGLKQKGFGTLVSVDNFSEGGAGLVAERTSQLLFDAFEVSEHVRQVRATSPIDLSSVLGGDEIDLAFIDADHHGPSPLQDYKSVASRLSTNGILIFHDNDPNRYTVPEAVRQAYADGLLVAQLQTSCNLTMCFKDARWFSLIEAAYEAAKQGSPVWSSTE